MELAEATRRADHPALLGSLPSLDVSMRDVAGPPVRRPRHSEMIQPHA